MSSYRFGLSWHGLIGSYSPMVQLCCAISRSNDPRCMGNHRLHVCS
jgi:hypothetical protein